MFAILFGAASYFCTCSWFLDLWCLCMSFSDVCEWGGFEGMRVTFLHQSLSMLTLSSWSDFMDIHLHVRWDHTTEKALKNWGVVLKPCKHSKDPAMNHFCALLSIFLSLSGVPRQHRGEIWKFLSEQYLLRKEVPSTKPHNNDTPYKELLKQLTSQQHAILIDLG